MKKTSLWKDDAEASSYAPLQTDLDVDIAIVGGGITGITAAHLLAKAGKSVAVLEALALRVPVLAADSGGAQDLIEEGWSGWLFRSGDVNSLRDRIVMLATTAALERIQITDDIVRPYTAEVVGRQWVRVYEAAARAGE